MTLDMLIHIMHLNRHHPETTIFIVVKSDAGANTQAVVMNTCVTLNQLTLCAQYVPT